ncbi:hypothetical protein [Streptomyces sp. NBC_01716]|uniref:hypothetical protein n=1 Tax=Streptomyces sp. NBC_01716 TaxID=2975917 RepID=UPI003FCD5608
MPHQANARIIDTAAKSLGLGDALPEVNELVHGWRWRVEGREFAVVFTFTHRRPSTADSWQAA